MFFAQSLFNRWDKVARNHAANDGVLKFKIDIRIADGRKLDPHIAKLAVAAGLLLVPSLRSSRFS